MLNLIITFLKYILTICLLLVLSNALVFGQTSKPRDFVVVLDAGHGGHDPGARGVVENEKDIVLDVTLRLGKLIEDEFKDVKVVYTRRDDRFVELHQRANIANQNKADFFISIHCNSAARTSAYGTETFVLGTEDNRSSANFEVVKKENSVILLEDNYEEKYQGFDPNSPESFIGMMLMQNVHLENSLKFAAEVEHNFVHKDKRHSRGVKQAGFMVLWRAATPAVLIELGFISNQEEGRYLASIEGKRKSAESIFQAFKKYKHNWDVRRGNISKLEALPPAKQEQVKQEEAVAGVLYKVQFLTSTRRFRPTAPQLKGLRNVEIIQDGRVYKYYYGSTSFRSKRDELLREVRGKGFPDAFVVEFETADKPKQNTPRATAANTQSQTPAAAQAAASKPVANTAEASKTGYRIQIFSSRSNYSATAPQLKGLKPVDKIFENNFFKYFYGWFADENEARKQLDYVRGRGFADAFLVQFRNGEKQ
ncbi:MAG: N-acetylmuramoyl-L-alanine amidase [Weeksellaceae bacterium]|nr:N-acetylmuramoyl-L-alanine amidase [Weeksellaceae bacterium]